MKYYTYDNPNKAGPTTNWGSGRDADQLNYFHKTKCLRMHDDVNNPPGVPIAGDVILGGGHACCTGDAPINHPGFTEVDVGSVDGSAYWDQIDALEKALRLLDPLKQVK